MATIKKPVYLLKYTEEKIIGAKRLSNGQVLLLLLHQTRNIKDTSFNDALRIIKRKCSNFGIKLTFEQNCVTSSNMPYEKYRLLQKSSH